MYLYNLHFFANVTTIDILSIPDCLVTPVALLFRAASINLFRNCIVQIDAT
jgi:hypothetical protein